MIRIFAICAACVVLVGGCVPMGGGDGGDEPVVIGGGDVGQNDPGVPADGALDVDAERPPPDAEVAPGAPPVEEHGACVDAEGRRLDCASGLTCLVDGDPPTRGACKVLCVEDADCAPPQRCETRPSGGQDGFCAVPALEGEACDHPLDGARQCFEDRSPFFLPACVDGTCHLVCSTADGETRFLCPDGQGCGDAVVSAPGFAEELIPCEPGGRCVDAFAPDPCGDCVEAECCRQLSVCLTDERCTGCISDRDPGCDAVEAYAALAGCANLGGRCAGACLPETCEFFGDGACGRCLSDTCCEELQACLDIPECSVCTDRGDPAECAQIPEYLRFANCAARCNTACDDDVCGPQGSHCDADRDCCEGPCEQGFCAGCQPQCDGIECGPDGCGGQCGQCAEGGVCVDGACCQPQCDSVACGPDGCGGACGRCPAPETCTDEGQCICEPDCDALECGLDPRCGTLCGVCAAGALCQDGNCCEPQCDGRACGEDPACGVSCGRCAAGEVCDDGQCEPCRQIFEACREDAECCALGPGQGRAECVFGSCAQCASEGFQCGGAPCCDGLFCISHNICHHRNCSELGMRCRVNRDCCNDWVCDPEGGDTCQRCRPQNTVCATSLQCCAGLRCRDGACR